MNKYTTGTPRLERGRKDAVAIMRRGRYRFVTTAATVTSIGGTMTGGGSNVTITHHSLFCTLSKLSGAHRTVRSDLCGITAGATRGALRTMTTVGVAIRRVLAERGSRFRSGQLKLPTVQLSVNQLCEGYQVPRNILITVILHVEFHVVDVAWVIQHLRGHCTLRRYVYYQRDAPLS